MPLPAWTHLYGDPAASGFDAQDAAFFNQFISAFAERAIDYSALGPFTAAGAAGYDLQDMTVWLAMQNFFVQYSFTGFGFGAAVGITEIGAGVWFKPGDLSGIVISGGIPASTYSYDGRALTPTWFFDNCKTPGATYTFQGADGTFASGKGFTASYPKAFSNPTASLYPDLLAVVVGDYARNITDGKPYHCTAITAGVPTWVHAPDHLPDERLASEGGFRPVSSSGLGASISTPLGLMRHGDYKKPHLYNEMRDAIRMLHVHAGPLSNTLDSLAQTSWTADGTNNFQLGEVTLAGTAAAARAAAEAAYATSGSSVDAPPFALAVIGVGGGNATANIYRQRAKALIGTDNDGLTPSIDFYNWEFTATGTLITVYDQNGDSVDNDRRLTRFDTQTAGGAGADVKSAFLGTLALPHWPADTGGRRGYPEYTPIFGLAAFDYSACFVYA